MRLTLVSLGLVAMLATACAPLANTAPLARPVGSLAARSVGFEDLNGQPVSLDDYSGHPVLLAFLSPSNADAQAEIPLLLRLADAYQGNGLVVVGAGEGAGASALASFARSAGISFPLWQDPAGGELAQDGFSGVPAFLFIAADGQVVSRHAGFASRGELTAGIEGALAAR